MKRWRRLTAAAVLAAMCLTPVLAVSAAGGPLGSGGSSPGNRGIGDVYTYPGFKGKGPNPFQMINSFTSAYYGDGYEDEFADDWEWAYVEDDSPDQNTPCGLAL